MIACINNFFRIFRREIQQTVSVQTDAGEVLIKG